MNKIFITIFSVFVCGISYADDYITQNVVSGCYANDLMAVNNKTVLNAIFEPIEYSCSSGYFLPADGINCVPCPDGFTCSGGTFEFNEMRSGGINVNNTINQNVANICSTNLLNSINNTTKLRAVFEPMSIVCQPGYYLGADDIECTICPNDNYCPGGTYTFNETETQGITPCPENHPFAPAGMWLESQCGRKLHLGDDVLYMHQTPAHPTQHRLFIGHTNGVYSANAVAKVVGENNPKMSAGASKGLHVMIDNVEYLICDDSVCPNTPQE